MTAKLVAEFTGTFLLVFTVGCNVLSGQAVWGGVSIACVLMVAIYSLGGISGANFNPAVSVTLGIVQSLGGPGMEWKEVAMYCGTQFVAGVLAALCYTGLFSKGTHLSPAKGYGFVEVGVCEILYSFMLCFVVLNVACAKKGAKTPNNYFGLAIGFVIVAGAYGAGAISGGCFNPAVALGVDTSGAVEGNGFGWCAAYLFYEVIGAALAAMLFRVVRPNEFSDQHEATSELSKLVSEFLGTFMLVLTVGLNVLGASSAGAFSIAASLMCMIYALGDVSGAHFNPAVTVAVLCSGGCKDLSPIGACKYIAVQLFGGITAAFTYAGVYHGKTFALASSKEYGWVEIGVAEIVFTFVLCFVVLSVAVSKMTGSSEMFGLAIGSCVTVGGVAIGGISGGSLNPAVSFGIAASQVLNGGIFYKALLYSVFELVGAFCAAGLWRYATHAAECEPLSEKCGGNAQEGKVAKEV